MTTNKSELSTAEAVDSSGQSQHDMPVQTHRGPGSVHRGHRRASSAGSVPRSTVASLANVAKIKKGTYRE